jgi:hypothetical protein
LLHSIPSAEFGIGQRGSRRVARAQFLFPLVGINEAAILAYFDP